MTIITDTIVTVTITSQHSCRVKISGAWLRLHRDLHTYFCGQCSSRRNGYRHRCLHVDYCSTVVCSVIWQFTDSRWIYLDGPCTQCTRPIQGPPSIRRFWLKMQIPASLDRMYRIRWLDRGGATLCKVVAHVCCGIRSATACRVSCRNLNGILQECAGNA